MANNTSIWGDLTGNFRSAYFPNEKEKLEKARYYEAKTKELKHKRHITTKLQKAKEQYKEAKYGPMREDLRKLGKSAKKSGIGLNPNWFNWGP